MPRFLPEPAFEHGQSERIGVLLVNLGTPEAPTAKALRPYLREFLSDPRVVEIPGLLWKPILYGLILPLRSPKSAEKYRSIWTPEGSPLMHWTAQQAKLLRGYLGERVGKGFVVEHAMRYGQPSVETQLQKLKAAGCTRLLVLPLYPQYAGSSTGSVMDAVGTALSRLRNPPELRVIKHYHDDPAYIDALAASIQRHWQLNGRGDHLLMSFHGVPKATLLKGDPYHCECQKTGRLLAEKLGLGESHYTVAFQSRFGKAEWLKPYTASVLAELGKKGGAVDVVCPGFAADCLETLEEIAMEGKDTFLRAGGKVFRYVPCLNDDPAFILALTALVDRHTAGWPRGEAADPQTALRAKALGAAR